MAASDGVGLVLNPFILLLKKMELELNCPFCLKLMNQPMLLPCDHMLCSNCTTTPKNDGFSCPVCGLRCLRKDLRHATHVERFTTIYQSMNSYISALHQGYSFEIPDSEAPFTRTPISCANHSGKKHARDNIRDSDSGSWNIEGLDKGVSSDEMLNLSTKHAKLHDPVGSKSDHQFQDDFTSRGTAKLHDPVGSKSDHQFQDDFTSRVVQDENAIETCAFCHSFRTTQATGEMLHYLDGLLISGDQTWQLNVLHVHQKCIEWAPQIYFLGEAVKNLEKELSRSSKIKCHSCGLKGAALGCYVKSCKRSYHVPCAYEIPECQWDYENFLMLCPAHVMHKLPCDKFKSKKSNESAASSDHQKFQTQGTSSSSFRKDLVICGSDLSKEEKTLLSNFARINCLTIAQQWKPNVTHVIAATNENGACIRTMKYLMAILSGRWVLNMGWIRACLAAERLLPEEKYEITCDNHGCIDGPKIGRTGAMQRASKLFNGLAFYFSGFSIPAYRSNLEDLVIAGEGSVLSKCELLNMSLASPAVTRKAFVVYCVEAPKGCNSAEEEKELGERLKDAETLGSKAGSIVVRHTLFLNAIAAHDLLLLRTK
ncbi:hypothetical protein HPP92_008347 [Vanilla planifolia]|uniref:RING-type E3 ubiquitin transferase BRCA1 n=1 Tax=Vanilla planifolia TaxID=51239 RepID=A0A835RHU4_VANPL|nr:hypothetical protein HPP92_008347 [Vanilla planifolia]